MSSTKTKVEIRKRRKIRSRGKSFGTSDRPRLSIYKSNINIYAQIINDDKSITLVAASSLKSGAKGLVKKAEEVGEAIAFAAKGAGVSQVTFDRGGFTYIGAISKLADTAREKGLDF